MADNEVSGSNSTGAEVGEAGTLDPGPPPQIAIKPGWKKSEGQLAGAFTGLSLVLAFLGYKFSPDKIENVYELIRTLAQVFGPLAIAGFGVLKTYINSRGRVTSNGIWATASMNNPQIKNGNILQGGEVADAVGQTGASGSVARAPSDNAMALIEYGRYLARMEAEAGKKGGNDK